MTDTDVVQSGSQAEPGPSLVDPGRVELPLQFEVGTATMTLDELRSLQPGFVFMLAGSSEAPVTIRVNGVAIGRGELVRAGDHIGVRLTEVFEHARQPA